MSFGILAKLRQKLTIDNSKVETYDDSSDSDQHSSLIPHRHSGQHRRSLHRHGSQCSGESPLRRHQTKSPLSRNNSRSRSQAQNSPRVSSISTAGTSPISEDFEYVARPTPYHARGGQSSTPRGGYTKHLSYMEVTDLGENDQRCNSCAKYSKKLFHRSNSLMSGRHRSSVSRESRRVKSLSVPNSPYIPRSPQIPQLVELQEVYDMQNDAEIMKLKQQVRAQREREERIIAMQQTRLRLQPSSANSEGLTKTVSGASNTSSLTSSGFRLVFDDHVMPGLPSRLPSRGGNSSRM